MKKHKHADVIIAWAYGAQIQVWSEKHNEWQDRSNPIWLNEWQYRVKPISYDVTTNRFVVSHG